MVLKNIKKNKYLNLKLFIINLFLKFFFFIIIIFLLVFQIPNQSCLFILKIGWEKDLFNGFISLFLSLIWKFSLSFRILKLLICWLLKVLNSLNLSSNSWFFVFTKYNFFFDIVSFFPTLFFYIFYVFKLFFIL